jgi:hypothetical protein
MAKQSGISVRAENLDKVVRALGGDTLTKWVKQAVKAENKRTALAIANHYSRSIKPAFNTGAMQDGVAVAPFDNYNAGFSVGNLVLHSLFYELGTEPHFISPVNARLLSFFWDKIAKNVALPFVEHPGTEANLNLTEAWLKFMATPEDYTGRVRKRLESTFEALKRKGK